jgi:hypothetical protein
MIRLRGSTGQWRWLVLRALLIGGLAVLASCANPTGPATASDESGDGAPPVSGTPGEAGSVRVSIGSGDGLSASTIFPDQDLSAVASYRVSATDGPAGAPIPPPAFIAADEVTGQPASSLAIGEVVPGTWTIEVEGLDPSGEPIFHGAAQGVSVVAGQETTASITLGYIADGEGGFEITIEWPTGQNIKNVEYHLGPGPWSVVSGSEFELSPDGETTSAVISGSGFEAGSYRLTARLDAGTMVAWERYRAMIDERLYIYRGIATTTTITLGANAFSFRPPDPGSWEDLEDSGGINIEPDGGITFNPEGYDPAAGGNNIDVDPDDGSVTFSNAGERRLYMDTPEVTHGRLELTDAGMTTGNGWGIYVHGALDGSNRYSGYTIQFDPGLGNRIVVRQWRTNTEYNAFLNVGADGLGIDLYQPMDVTVTVNGGTLLVEVTQAGTGTVEVFNETDITAIANFPGDARTSGFMGFRAWSGTDLTVGGVKLYVFD